MQQIKSQIPERNWIYVITTALVVIMSFVTGIGNLIPFEHIKEDLIHLGYPPYFRIILGTWKVMGAIAIAFSGKSRIKDLAYGGIILDLSSAAVSRMLAGDGPIKTIVPLMIIIPVTISWWNYSKRTEYKAK